MPPPLAFLMFDRYPCGDASLITGRFGETGPAYSSPHRGVDIGVPDGTPIVMPSIEQATVVDFYNDGSFGDAICLDHVGTPWYSLYAHLSSVYVEIGQVVQPGDIIGQSGHSGRVTGPHLHWQVCRSSSFPIDISQSADPLSYFVGGINAPITPPATPIDGDPRTGYYDELGRIAARLADISASLRAIH